MTSPESLIEYGLLEFRARECPSPINSQNSSQLVLIGFGGFASFVPVPDPRTPESSLWESVNQVPRAGKIIR
jgi:hypothetical protein